MRNLQESNGNSLWKFDRRQIKDVENLTLNSETQFDVTKQNVAQFEKDTKCSSKSSVFWSF